MSETSESVREPVRSPFRAVEEAREDYLANELARAARYRARIGTLARIAVESGSSLSLEEALDLLPAEEFPDAETVAEFVRKDPELSRELAVLGREITRVGREDLASIRDERRAVAWDHLGKGRELVRQLVGRCPWTRVVGVSGSTAYGGARAQDDLDFFIVVDSNRVWVTLFFALLLARRAKAQGESGPTFCFNCVWDEAKCEEAFRDSQDPLFAREALTLVVLSGEDHYRSLLESAPWMAAYFPRLYFSRQNRPIVAQPRQPGGGPFWTVVNLAVATGLVPYLWIINARRNRQLRRTGRSSAQFATVLRPGFFALESRRFSELRKSYVGIFE